MNTWIYKQTITTPTGSQIDEIECPRCGYCQTVPGCRQIPQITGTSLLNVRLLGLAYKRPSYCYVCCSELDPDDFFKENIARRIIEDGTVKMEADV